MKRVWAPWRMEYLFQLSKEKLASTEGEEPCVFCDRPSQKPGADNLVLFKGKFSYVILNRYPYTQGHLMVIPYRHLSDYAKITAKEHTEMGLLLARSIACLNKVYKPQGMNVGMNLGEAAGAGIRDHLHYHIVPRWNGDHNYMTVVGSTRVLMEDLSTTYKKLKKVF
ncbi:MAG: hit histidine triad protein [uncultured bacterium]|nr:MAG: hit histidine triad protein [uncultured bacterium]